MLESSHARAGRLVTAPIFLSLLILVAGCGLTMDHSERLQRAEQAYASGEYRAAVIDTKRILQDEPENRAARLLLGRSSLRSGDPATAELELQRAVALGTDISQVVVDLGEALVRLGRYNEMLDEIRPDMAPSEADRLSVLRLRGDATMGLQLPESARDIYLEVLESDPTNSPARLGLASTYVAQQNNSEARRILDELLAADPEFAQGWRASASLHLASGDAELAVKDFERAVELSAADDDTEDQAQALGGLIEAHLAAGDTAAARAAVEELQSLTGGNIASRYLTARVAYLEEDLDTAQSELQQVLKAAPEYRPAQLLLGAVNLQRGNLGQAEMYLSAVVSAAPASANARRLLAETRLRQDRAEEAQEVLRPLLGGDDRDATTLNLAVRASLEAGDYDNAIAYLNEAVASAPDEPGLQLDLAAAYLAAGEAEKAESIIRALPEDAGDASYRRDFLQVLAPLRRGDPSTAMREAEAMLERWPDDARVRNLIGGVALSMDRVDEARAHFLAAQELAPDDIAAYVNLARIETRRGDLDSARQQYLAALERRPESARIMVALGQLEARAANREAAVGWLEKARRVDPGSLAPRLLLSRYYLAEDAFESARELAAEAIALDSDNAELYNILGLAQQGIGDHADASASFEQAIRLASDVSAYRMNKARAEIALGDAGGAEQTLLDAGADSLGNLRPASMLAIVRARQGDTEAALELARGLQERHPDDPVPFALEGELLASQDDFTGAAVAFEQALALREDDRRLALHAFRARERGGVSNPAAPLAAYLTEQPGDAEVRLILAQHYQNRGEGRRAVVEYERVLESESQNFVALNNLAWEYAQLGDSRAEAMARRAWQLRPDNGSVADTLGWIQVKNGDLEAGIPMLRRAVELTNGRAQVRYHLAAGLAAAGEVSEARQLLEELLTSGEEFASSREARELLASL
ncbi:XrtA/PEP-CTERM system TPR-repeat protein PrsT [Lentisalinibacter sediminis]|uniref:XrtA/PEP-CTERM system TPR-repeat protein PrsT n=1 Tax=Lentisalinibacter sediminis TaxID=2992237 RepID=UPI00386F3DA3